MDYPEHIYSKFEIIEKEIYGEVHYCAVKVSDWGWFKIKKRMKVYDCQPGGFFSNYGGRTWNRSRLAVERAIQKHHMEAEWAFEKKVTK